MLFGVSKSVHLHGSNGDAAQASSAAGAVHVRGTQCVVSTGIVSFSYSALVVVVQSIRK